MSGHRIQPLPSEVAAKLKSSTSITHLNGVIVELVKNALDANARTIFVTVDYRRGGCIVEDDGDGIPPAEFETGGGLARAHHTSKFHPEAYVYGQRGLFLASLSSLSLLTITSHYIHHPSTNTIIFHHSSLLARLAPAPMHQGLRFSEHGTSVTVNDLFGNMPVRVKHRALTFQKPDELERQWDELRYMLVSFMVANKQLLKLVLSDVDRDRKLTIRPRSHGTWRNSEPELPRISSILAQAELVDPPSHNSWHAVSACVPHLSIHAALSLVPNPTRKVQFISLGIEPIFPLNHANILYSEVNRLFSLSDFGTVGSFSSTAAYNGPQDGQFDGHRSTTKPVPKAVNKWPMFYICINSVNLMIEGRDSPESNKSLQHIIDVLTAMISEFLRQHNMRPRAGKRKRKESLAPGTENIDSVEVVGGGAITSTEDTLSGQLKLPSFSRPIASPHFGDWSRVRSARSHSAQTRSYHSGPTVSIQESSRADQGTREKQPRAETTEHGSRELTGSTNTALDGLSLRPPQQVGTILPAQTEDTNEKQLDTVIPWTDPFTARCHWVNSRTCQSIDIRSPAAVALAIRPRSTGSLRTVRAADSAKRPASAASDRARGMWIGNLLDTWENPVFGRSEQPINALDISENFGERCPETRTRYSSGILCGLDSFGVSKFRGKLRKQDLATAEVISQVDQKFILAKINTTASKSNNGPGSALLLVDQHAADERCRVESLFAQFFDVTGGSPGVQTMQVNPIIFDIPVSEASIFIRHAGFFKLWGVEYGVEPEPQHMRASVTVSRLPTLIAERCRTEPGLVASLIRREIWNRDGSGGGQARAPSSQEGWSKKENWVDRLAGCPQGILDLLNSRACRTAIMFNDALSTVECQSLLKRLTRCVFPFQCAHGRPSMVPILDLSGTFGHDIPNEYNGVRGGGDSKFTEAFKRWQSSSTRPQPEFS